MPRGLVGMLVMTAVAVWLPPGASADSSFPHSVGDPSRGFELVSPPDKPGGIGVGVTYTSPYSMSLSGAAAHVGDRHAVQGYYGSTLTNAGFAFGNDFAFADRVSDQVGWVSHSPITRPLHSRQFTRFITPTVATPNYGRVVWQANGVAPIFPEMAGWMGQSPGVGARFVSDWVGRWELLNMTDLAQAPGGSENVTESAVSANGRVAVSSGGVHGLDGPGDPAALSWGDRLAGESVYTLDIAGELTDAFPAADVASRYELVNACTGSGVLRTRIPQRLADGSLSDQSCSAPLAGRDERLVSPYGGSTRPAFYGTGRRWAHPDVVSDDGSRVFFMAPDQNVSSGSSPGSNPGALTCTADVGAATKCPAQLYVRQRNADGSRVVRWLSRPAAGLLGIQLASLLGPAVFEGASADGDKVFFRTISPLTDDDPNAGCVARQGAPLPCISDPAGAQATSWDLYMFDLADGPDPTGPGSSLTRITAGPGADGDCNNPQGALGSFFPIGSQPAASLRFISEDGRRVYFVCSAPLAGAAGPSDPDRVTSPSGTAATITDTNLYLYDSNFPVSQRWRFIARIPRDARVAPNDPPVDHAKVCASTGALGDSILGATSTNSATLDSGPSQGAGCVRGTSNGEFVTFWTPGRLTADDPVGDAVDIYGYDADSDELVRITAAKGVAQSSYQCVPDVALECYGDMGWGGGSGSPFLGVATDPLVAGERVAFFQSRSRLVPEDTDDAFDVYEWRDGELSLLTTGSSAANDGAVYRGNDVTGRNVYFATRDALTWQDTDAVADVYVARTGSSGVPQPAPAAECELPADGCQAPGAPFAAPPAGRGSELGGGGDAAPGVVRRLSVGRVGRVARLRAVRSGVLTVRVRVNTPGRVRAVARARVGGKRRRVGVGRLVARRPARLVVGIRLSRAARERLADRGRLVVGVRVVQRGVSPDAIGVVLKRRGR